MGFLRTSGWIRTIHFEELDAAVLTESKSKEKNLDGKGMKIPGGCIFMTPESVGKEIGSLVRTKRPFMVKTISFTVESNVVEGCRASLRIYRMESGDSLVNIVTMPLRGIIMAGGFLWGEGDDDIFRCGDLSLMIGIFVVKFISHLSEGNRRTQAGDAVRPLLFYL